MDKDRITPGTVIGRWTVLDTYEKTSKGETKWLCRCECGTERYVLERSLRHGGSYSCGCLREERHREAVSTDLSGKVFGDLTVCIYRNISTKMAAFGGAVSFPAANAMIVLPLY